MAPKNHRVCVSCRQTQHRDLLWRVVRLSNSKDIQLDSGSGRSAYLCPTSQCLSIAKKGKKLQRALRAPVPEQIYQDLAQRLADSAQTNSAQTNGAQTNSAQTNGIQAGTHQSASVS